MAQKFCTKNRVLYACDGESPRKGTSQAEVEDEGTGTKSCNYQLVGSLQRGISGC